MFAEAFRGMGEYVEVKAINIHALCADFSGRERPHSYW